MKPFQITQKVNDIVTLTLTSRPILDFVAAGGICISQTHPFFNINLQDHVK